MSKYPITKPAINWSYYGFCVIAGCMIEISGMNPGLINGRALGLLQHRPGTAVTTYISNNYPSLTYNDGLAQIEFYSNACPWIYETIDDWGSFDSFAENCTNDIQREAEHFLYQIGYCLTRADAAQKALDFYQTIYNLWSSYQNKDPYDYKLNKWISGNRQLTAAETGNNTEILFAYSQGVVYKNLIWLYFKRRFNQ